jgi:hypothetical protein
MRASDSSGRQTAKDSKNKHRASFNRAKLIVACGYRAHGALLQVGIPICFTIER